MPWNEGSCWYSVAARNAAHSKWSCTNQLLLFLITIVNIGFQNFASLLLIWNSEYILENILKVIWQGGQLDSRG